MDKQFLQCALKNNQDPESWLTELEELGSRDAIVNHFNRSLPGFLCEDGLLHGVETRTSSPVRISRNPESLQAIGIEGLYPAGEGAGFAGGIVSAAVDGIVVADAILNSLIGQKDNEQSRKWGLNSKSVGFTY
jgi:hypothetical protein